MHITCPEGIALVTEAKKLGVRVTAETCPHYLLLDDAAAIRIGPAAKCAPPLRLLENQSALWDKLLTGEIDTLGSDHSPAPPEMKLGGDIFTIWGGIAGIQHALPLLLSHSREIIPQLSANVARIFNLPGKGALIPGHDADFIIVTPQPFTVTRESLLTRHPISPYIGLQSDYRIAATYLRGEKITSKTRGKFISPLRS